MEDWQKAHITANLSKLTEYTNCGDKIFLAYLQEKQILIPADIQKLELLNLTKLDKAAEFYKILFTKEGSYDVLVDAFTIEDPLNGALKILLDGYGTLSATKKFNKFSKVPPDIAEFLNNKTNGSKSICIISSIDPSITCLKIAENYKNAEVLRFENFLGLLSSSNINMFDKSNVVVLLSLSLEKISRVLNILEDPITRKSFTNRMLITTNASLSELQKYSSTGNVVKLGKDEMEWGDLSVAYQYKIENKLKENIGILLNENEIKNAASGKVLVDLINGNELKLFQDIIPKEPSCYMNRTLVTRNVLDKNELRTKFQDKSHDDIIFIFTGMSENESPLNDLVQNDMTFRTTEVLRSSVIKRKFMTLDNSSHFEEICKKTDKNVHLIEYYKESDEFVLKRSRGQMDIIRKSIADNQEHVSEAEFLNNLNVASASEPVCISDSPGMGKSVLLAKIGEMLQEKFPERIVLFVELNKLSNEMKDFNFYSQNQPCSSSAVKNVASDSEYSVDKILCNLLCKTELEKVILFKKLNAETLAIELLLDGLDEFNSEDFEDAFGILKELKKKSSVRFWLTTRPHLLHQVEDELSILGFNILPFDRTEQVNYLIKLWTQKLDPSTKSKANLDRLKTFAEARLEMLESKLKSKKEHSKIAEIPLQCYLLGEVYAKEAVETLTLMGEDPSLPKAEIDSIVKLYVCAVDIKLAKYKRTYEISEAVIDEATLKLWLGKLAAKLIFPKKTDFIDNLEEKEMVELIKVGILQRSSTTSSPAFIHRTFAEYFVADFVLNELQNEEVESTTLWKKGIQHLLSDEILLGSEIRTWDYLGKTNGYTFCSPVTCHFFNSLIFEGFDCSAFLTFIKKLPDSFLKLESIAYACASHNFINIFDLIFSNNAQQINIFNEGFLYYTLKRCEVEFVEIAFKHFKDHFYEFSPSLQNDILQCVVKRGEFSKLQYVVNTLGLREKIKSFQEGEKNLLGECVRFSFKKSDYKIEERVKMVGFLVEINPELLNFAYDGVPPLLEDLVDIKLILKMIKLGANVLSQDRRQNTVLHVGGSHLSSVDYDMLVDEIPSDKLKQLMKVRNDDGHTPLVSAIKRIDLSKVTFDKFKYAEANFNEVIDGLSVLAFAIKSGRNANTLNNLILNGSNVSWTQRKKTLLDFAAKFGNEEAVRCLVEEYRFNINGTDFSERTPLEYLIKRNNGEADEKWRYRTKEKWKIFYKTGVEIIRLGGKLSSRRLKNGHSWLHKAIILGNLAAVKLLLDFELSDVNKTDNNLNTPLHLAMKIYDKKLALEIIKLLLEKGADANILNKKKENPFNSALKNRNNINWELVILLKSKNAIKLTKDTKEAATNLIQFLIDNENWDNGSQNFDWGEYQEILEQCLKNGGNVNCRGKGKNSILHAVARRGHLPSIKYLITNTSVDINATNSKGQTPLHVLCSCSPFINWDSVKYLINNGADLLKLDCHQNTFLNVLLDERNYLRSQEFNDLSHLLITEKNQAALFNMQNQDGVSPLHKAVKLLRKLENRTLQLLHSNGVDFRQKDKNGESILFYAVRGKSSPEFISLLINSYGADVGHVRNDKKGLLHCAAGWGTVETLKVLLSTGKFDPPNSVDNKGNTPLHDALFDDKGHTPFHYSLFDDDYNKVVVQKVKILIEGGASVNVRNKLGKTPLAMIFSYNSEEIREELLRLLTTDDAERLRLLVACLEMEM